MPELEKTDNGSSSGVDVNSPHISSVKSDFEDDASKAEAEGKKMAGEAEDKARDFAAEAKSAANDVSKKAKTKGKEAEKKMREGGKKLEDNRDNPVVIGNAILLAVGTIALGVGAYQKHQEGKLDWQLAGMVAGVVGVFGVADYVASQ